jgi:hypothetical protein
MPLPGRHALSMLEHPPMACVLRSMRTLRHLVRVSVRARVRARARVRVRIRGKLTQVDAGVMPPG